MNTTKTLNSGRLLAASVLVLGGLIIDAATERAAAQEVRAAVQGVVVDPSGAVVVGAKVTLGNDNTAVEVTRRTDGTGRYLFDYVIPGTYTLAVELEGFRTFVQRRIRVETRGDVTVNAPLEVGEVAETVTVEESPVAVSFNRGSMETTVDMKMTNDLPIVHRNPFLLTQLNPAVSYGGGAENSPYHHWAAGMIDVGGNTGLKNDVIVDGSPQLIGPKNTYTPPMDAVSEVSVQQNATDAEFGHSAGGIISLQMKSGTNDWHGTAYYFGRNPALNAVSDSTTHSPNEVRNHTWGATSQNPIVKNKLFNFFAYEATNTRTPKTKKWTLPTSLERQGDFSQTILGNGQLRTIFDPLTTDFDPVQGVAPRQPFPGNRLPQDRIDFTAARFMDDIWAPNRPGEIVNNYVFTAPDLIDYWNISNRTDYNVSENVKIFGRLSLFRTDTLLEGRTGSSAENRGGSRRNTTQAAGDLVWTVNPTTVWNVRGSFSTYTDRFHDEAGEIGMEGLEGFWPGNPWYEPYQNELSAIYYPGLEVFTGSASRFGRGFFWYQEPWTWNSQSKLSKQKGRHYIKIGGEFRQKEELGAVSRPMNFQFVRDHTASTAIKPDIKKTGDAWATMLLGTVDHQSAIWSMPMNRARSEFYAVYVQDDFKLNSRVTLNLGLRWEYETAFKDPDRRLSRYLDLTSPIPEFQGDGAPAMPPEVMAIRGSAPAYNGAWVFTDDDHPGAWSPPKNLLLPRAGVAVRLNSKTALRVGYARYVVPSTQETTGRVGAAGQVPYIGFTAVSRPLSVLQGVPRAHLSDPYPADENPLILPAGKSRGRYTGLGDTTFWYRQDWKNGVNDRVNVSLQREMWNRIVVDVTWFANFGKHHALYFQKEERLPNLMDPRFAFTHKAALERRVNNPFFQALTPEKFPGPLRNFKKVRVRDLLTPYPHYLKLEEAPVSEAGHRYQAFQISAKRAFANGVTFLTGYNYNRSRDQLYFDDQDRFDGLLSWVDSFKPRHRLTLGGIVEFPFGRGRRWGRGWNPVVDGILGGWSASAIYVYRTGTLLYFERTDLVSGDPRVEKPTRERWFDTSVFEKQPAYTRRANPWTWDGLTGPRYTNIDVTLQKQLRITERISFELRMDAYNLTNSFMGADPSRRRTDATFGQVVDQLKTHKGREFQYSGRFRW